jgi:hypothetical protein
MSNPYSWSIRRRGRNSRERRATCRFNESAIAAQTGKQQRIFSILAVPGENPSKKHLRIQQFARLSTVNSLCNRTGNQFDHNREFNSRQQGSNSTQQGISRKSIFARRLE